MELISNEGWGYNRIQPTGKFNYLLPPQGEEYHYIIKVENLKKYTGRCRNRCDCVEPRTLGQEVGPMPPKRE